MRLFWNKNPWNVSSSGRNGYALDINLVQLLWRSTDLAMLLLCPWRPVLFRSCGQVCPPAGQITQWLLGYGRTWNKHCHTLPHVIVHCPHCLISRWPLLCTWAKQWTLHLYCVQVTYLERWTWICTVYHSFIMSFDTRKLIAFQAVYYC